MPNPANQTATRTKIDVREPPMFKVIYLNDEHTSMEFVINSLIHNFDYDMASAEKITVDIHESGSATVAVMPYELAEQKGVEITFQARSQGFPLQIKLEPDA